ncbi:dihydrofolate reductase family protein [Streptosporangium roseum]|uniref:Bacterial bifunctional deaminase-reductase C-terminal domain-containing protein n=1 Tax=Streptosporangium roseum (strain ATCC 12428 / DSM 43021 / JCM 3005 / KCTC 9067 / NCIMB 10171 / NRRL 2505 / NI 9100) TaxID=479432 RepID=D2AR64_STRRD|nr:dihydrofolate reductase family protein [Streptosporangium roseum]ACZ88405.1 hypothetical protein Sros_5654 [Streptosporangium roseum DSM 43021]
MTGRSLAGEGDRDPTWQGASDRLHHPGQGGLAELAPIDGDVVAALAKLKQQPGKCTNLPGSISLPRALPEAGLIDRLRLLMQPIVPGTGRRLFPEGAGVVPLKLTRSATLTTGVTDLTCRPA